MTLQPILWNSLARSENAVSSVGQTKVKSRGYYSAERRGRKVRKGSLERETETKTPRALSRLFLSLSLFVYAHKAPKCVTTSVKAFRELTQSKTAYSPFKLSLEIFENVPSGRTASALNAGAARRTIAPPPSSFAQDTDACNARLTRGITRAARAIAFNMVAIEITHLGTWPGDWLPMQVACSTRVKIHIIRITYHPCLSRRAG